MVAESVTVIDPTTILVSKCATALLPHLIQMQTDVIPGYLHTDTVREDDSGIRGAVEYGSPTIPEHLAIRN